MALRSVELAERALRDGAHLRVVQHARLRLASRDDEHATRFALEDGLNTADFSDCGRLIVVRHLRLAGLKARASGTEWARALETAWQGVATTAVSADDPRAAQALAVYFRSVHEARLRWLTHVVHARAVDAWFWNSAVPEMARAHDPQAALVAVIAILLRETPLVLADQVAGWTTPVLRRLVDLLPSQLPASMQAAESGRGPRPRASMARSEAEADAVAHAAARTSPLVRGGGDDIRIALVAELCLIAELRRAAEPVLVEQALRGAEAMQRVSAAASKAADEHLQASPPVSSPPSVAAGHVPAPQAAAVIAQDLSALHGVGVAGTRPRRLEQGTELTTATPPGGAVVVPVPVEAHPAAALAAHAAFPWLADALPTAHGGLLMLINVLDALGFDVWLALQPAEARWGFVACLLRSLAERCGVPDTDPQCLLFETTDADVERVREAELTWDRFAWPTWFTPAEWPLGGPSAEASMRRWRVAVRCALRVHARIGMASLVQRDAAVAVSQTHVDVIFPLDAVDIRLRRHGLDADPRWVRWFGRIVSFHFIVRGAPDA